MAGDTGTQQTAVTGVMAVGDEVGLPQSSA